VVIILNLNERVGAVDEGGVRAWHGNQVPKESNF